MSDLAPVVVVGAGPAGVSAAWALLERGVPVTLLDAGTKEPRFPAAGAYLDLRRNDRSQWRWQLGETFAGLAGGSQASPKLRIPGLSSIFDGYAEANRIRAEESFQLVGALAAGGLSNAWGCGVAAFEDEELGPLSADRSAMRASYARVARRIGLSGASNDALSEYFGVDDWAAPALPLDPLQRYLWERRERLPRGMRLGRGRVAVLNEEREGRGACDQSGTCLWGCVRRATWSASIDLAQLKRHPDFRHVQGVRVQSIRRSGEHWEVQGTRPDGSPHAFTARRVVMAAGTIATTRLILEALSQPPQQLRLLSNPMAAFLLLLPAQLGRTQTSSFGLAQQSFVLDELCDHGSAMGNLFSTAGLPVSEFLQYLPVTRRAGLPLLRTLLPAAIVGNLFLPGTLSRHQVTLDADGGLRIRGGLDPEVERCLSQARRRIARSFRRLGAYLLPGSFVPGNPGADLHYAGTLPIAHHPSEHECHLSGEVAGLPGLHVVDGACLPNLPAKAHTLTIMANADRIARAMRTDF
jgi:choline dehydrogenase-like flavoprotein